MKKHIFYSELAYIIGLIVLALGVTLMEKADFGVSMVVAPAYLIYLKLNPLFSFFTFGMAEYLLQAVLLVVLIAILRKARISYLFSFVTAVIYGFILDGWMALFAAVPATFAVRIAFYILGMAACSLGVSLLFHTYISPEVYELFVKELYSKTSLPIHRFKTIYDCTSLAVSIIMSFIFFGLWHFEGVKLGTILCALINGWIIGRFTKLLESRFDFKDGLELRKYFE